MIRISASEYLFTAGNFLHCHCTCFGIFLLFKLNCFDCLKVALVICNKLFYGCFVNSRIASEYGDCFFRDRSLFCRLSATAGQGLLSERSSGSLGIISICVTDLQPCLITVPVQSFPVSPPPTITTFLPLALAIFSVLEV